MYLHIGNNQMLPQRRIIGVFDLEITSQSKITAAFLKRAEQEGVVVDACEDIPKSFLLCDHPYHRQIVYLSQLGSRTLMSRAEEREGTGGRFRPGRAIRRFPHPTGGDLTVWQSMNGTAE